MSGPFDARWRTTRAATFGSVSTLLAMMGHSVGGGGIADPAIVIVPAFAVGFAATSVAARPRSFNQIFALLSACQIAFHLLFSLASHPSGAATAMHLNLPRMMFFHLLAAAVAAVVLARAEAVLFRLYAAVRRVLVAVRGQRPVDLPVRWTALTVPPGSSRRITRTLGATPRRGPPAPVV